ncbi:MAG: glycosyltransferase family 2 protein [Spirochaetota bacterium]
MAEPSIHYEYMPDSTLTFTPTSSHSELAPFAHLVSVVTPVYNEAAYLDRCVASVASQSVPVFEHIIVDDGSTDETSDTLELLAARYLHIVVVTQARRGAAAARNVGIERARGRYIAFLDADDVWHPRKVEHQIRFMEERGYSFTYGDYVEVEHRTGRRLKGYHLPDSVGHRQLLRGCPIGCLTVAYNQETIGKRYMPLVRSGHDWGLWLELTREGMRAHKYPGVEASYSNGRASLSTRKLRKVLYVYRIYRDNEGLSRAAAILRALGHSVAALMKKARLLYSS